MAKEEETLQSKITEVCIKAAAQISDNIESSRRYKAVIVVVDTDKDPDTNTTMWITSPLPPKTSVDVLLTAGETLLENYSIPKDTVRH